MLFAPLLKLKLEVPFIPVVVYYKNFEGYLYFKFDNGFSCFLLKSDESYDIYTNSLIVYDRFNKLKPVPLSYTDELKGKIINEITFLFDRFINFYIIKDVISSMQYLLEISEKIIEFLSVLLEVPKVHRNNISALKTVGEEFASKLLEIVEGLNIDTVKETSIKMFVFIDKFVSSVPINVAYSIDIDYYNYIKKELLKL